MTTHEPTTHEPTTHVSARDRVHGGALLVAPLLLLASSIAYYVIGSQVAGGVIAIYAIASVALAAPALTRPLDATMPRTATTLTALIIFCFVAGGVPFNVAAIMVASGATPLQELAVFPVIALPGVIGPLALVATGVALYRAGAAPRFAPIALALGGLLFPISRIGQIAPLAIAVDLLLCASFIALGLSLLQGSARTR